MKKIDTNQTVQDKYEGNWSGKKCPQCGAETFSNLNGDEWCSYTKCDWNCSPKQEQDSINTSSIEPVEGVSKETHQTGKQTQTPDLVSIDKNIDTNKSFFDYSDEEKKAIINKAAEEANEAQQELMEQAQTMNVNTENNNVNQNGNKAQTIKQKLNDIFASFEFYTGNDMSDEIDAVLTLFASQRKQDMQELREEIIRLRIDRGEKDYPQYCEDDAECFGDCSKSRDYGNNSAINIILALLAEKVKENA